VLAATCVEAVVVVEGTPVVMCWQPYRELTFTTRRAGATTSLKNQKW
jgi:hypothetical protein